MFPFYLSLSDHQGFYFLSDCFLLHLEAHHIMWLSKMKVMLC